jgi:catalase
MTSSALQRMLILILFALHLPVQGQTSPRFKAVAFDYFVIFDPDSILPAVEEVAPGRAAEFAKGWRGKQFEYGFLRSITGQHADFFEVTADALDYTAAAMQVRLGSEARTRLLNAYLTLRPWPDAQQALQRLRAAGVRIITIANFSPMMLRANADHAGLTAHFDQLLSTARNGTYKPSAGAYALGMQALGLKKEEIVFAAFGGWDAYGAKSFGYPTYWVNRFKLPRERVGIPPDGESHDMAGLLQFVLGDAAPAAASLRPGAEASEVRPDQVVAALEQTFGVHPGERRNHIKGTCAAGTFVGHAVARPYTRSALFSGEPVEVVARFSLPGGNPHIADTARIPRGLALEFQLADGSRQHMTMLNTPVFGASSPQAFFDEIVARRPKEEPGKPDPERIKAFHASHPDSQAQLAFLARHNPPPSWTHSNYFGIHTFKFVNHEAKTTLVRWRFVPKDGAGELSNSELSSAPQQFLETRLIERLRRGPVQWDMVVTIGEAGDPETDPTRLWPEDRREIKAGTLSITSAQPQKGAACENVNFDPLIMSDGIEPTEDPVLLFRSPAYAISFGKRVSGQ